VGIGAGFALFGASLALATPAKPGCPLEHPCHHVLHVGPSGSRTGHVAWDSKERFPEGPIGVGVNYSPKQPTDAGLRTDAVGECGVHFVLPARFTGFANRCGKGMRPLHVQFANVTLKHLRIGVTYWVPTPPQFTG
jgi:hypothetical protein